jgi:NitT/TauT family transport system substrate-binding protein
MTPLRIVLLPVPSVAPVVYGARCGFYAKHGLEITTEIASSGPAAAQLVAAGEADLGLTAWHPLSAIWVNGGPFVVAIDGNVLGPAEGAVMVAADSEIESLADLEGKTVANAAPGSVFEVAFKAAMQDAGLAVDSAQLVVVPITEQVPAVLSGSVDAVVLTEPFTTIGKAQGLKVIAGDLFGGRVAEGSSGGYMAFAPWAAQNVDIILRARAVWAEVAQLLNDNEEAYRSYLPTFTALTPELAAVIALGKYRLTTEVANIQPSIDLTAAVGVIPEAVDVTPFVIAPD